MPTQTQNPKHCSILRRQRLIVPSLPTYTKRSFYIQRRRCQNHTLKSVDDRIDFPFNNLRSEKGRFLCALATLVCRRKINQPIFKWMRCGRRVAMRSLSSRYQGLAQTVQNWWSVYGCSEPRTSLLSGGWTGSGVRCSCRAQKFHPGPNRPLIDLMQPTENRLRRGRVFSGARGGLHHVYHWPATARMRFLRPTGRSGTTSGAPAPHANPFIDTFPSMARGPTNVREQRHPNAPSLNRELRRTR